MRPAFFLRFHFAIAISALAATSPLARAVLLRFSFATTGVTSTKTSRRGAFLRRELVPLASNFADLAVTSPFLARFFRGFLMLSADAVLCLASARSRGRR